MAPPLLSDAELVAACLAGDRASWDTLLDRYHGFIFALILRMGVSTPDAEDLFQNVCLRLYQNLGTLRDVDRLTNWLAVTIRHEVWTFRRRRKVSLQSEMPDYAWEQEGVVPVGMAEEDTPEETLLAQESQHLVRECMKQLPEECRTLLTMLYHDDPPRTYLEVAQHFSLPVGSIGPKRARCLKRLQKLLEKFGF